MFPSKISPNITNWYPKLVFWCKIIATYLRENLLHFLQLQESIRIGAAKCFRSEMTQHLILGGNNPGSRIPNCCLRECRLQNAVCPSASNIKKSCFKGELTNFFLFFVFLRSSIINFTPKIFPSKNVFTLIKSAIIFS